MTKIMESIMSTPFLSTTLQKIRVNPRNPRTLCSSGPTAAGKGAVCNAEEVSHRGHGPVGSGVGSCQRRA